MADTGGELATITLTYHPGLAYSPVTYSVIISTEGVVTLKGSAGHVLDEHYGAKVISDTKSLSDTMIKSLVDAVYEVEFFSLDERYYDYRVSDLPTETISVLTKSGRKKEVIMYGFGPDRSAPERFNELARKIREITGVEEWLRKRFRSK